MKKQHLTPEERIAAMKERVNSKAERQKSEEDRQSERAEKINDVLVPLFDRMLALDGMPAKPNGQIKVNRDWHDYEQRIAIIKVVRSGWEDINGEVENFREDLIVFHLYANHQGTEAWIEHDDTRIGADVAFDLAVAAVEAILDA